MRAVARVAFTVAAVLAGAMPCVANKVWVVAPSGPADFSQIQPAVDAASDGDTILVKPGSYPGFTIDDKALSVVGDTGALFHALGTISVRNLSAGKTAVLGNFITWAASSPAMRVRNSTGSVRVQAAQFGVTSFQTSSPTAAVEILSCGDVFLTACSLTGADGAPNVNGSVARPGGNGMTADASNVAIYDCTLQGGRGGNGGNQLWGSGAAGGNGCRVMGGFVFASNSVIRGGQGGDSSPEGNCFSGFGYVGDGGDGVSISAPAHGEFLGVTAEGGPIGQDHGSNPAGCVCPNCLCGCYGGNDGVPIDDPALVHVIPGSPRVLQAPLVVRENASVPLDFQGAPNDALFLYMARQTLFQFSLPRKGVYVLPMSSPILAIGTADGAGHHTNGFIAPDLGAAAQSRVYFLQSLHRTGAAERTLGTGRCVVVLDQAF